jgi:hypothetical protein
MSEQDRGALTLQAPRSLKMFEVLMTGGAAGIFVGVIQIIKVLERSHKQIDGLREDIQKLHQTMRERLPYS